MLPLAPESATLVIAVILCKQSSFVKCSGRASHTWLKHEYAACLWRHRELGVSKVFPQRGHVQRAPVGPAETRHRRVRDRQLDVLDQFAGRTEPVDPTA